MRVDVIQLSEFRKEKKKVLKYKYTWVSFEMVDTRELLAEKYCLQLFMIFINFFF